MNSFFGFLAFSIYLYCGFALGFEFKRLSPDEARWVLPMDEWAKNIEYVSSGNFLYIKRVKDRSLSFYRTTSKEEKIFFQLKNGVVIFEDSTCEYKDLFKVQKVTQFLECGDRFCTKQSGEAKILNLGLIPKTLIWSKSNMDNCPVRMPHFLSVEELSRDEALYFDVFVLDDINLHNDFAKVRVTDNGFSYLDLSVCKKDKESCFVQDRTTSLYQKDLKKLQDIKNHKSHAALNELINFLKPCVESNDFKCVKKFFVGRGDFDDSEYRAYSDFEINEDLLNELRECLNYENLLPHLLGSRGLEKVCIFTSSPPAVRPPKGSTKLFPLTYPEAVRRRTPMKFNFLLPDVAK